QDPLPAGGGLFKRAWFPLLSDMPDIIATFVTADTAETEKEYNDATAFSFWGLYRLSFNGEETGEYGLYWIDCAELRVEPKDLKDEFLDFWTSCMRFKVKPRIAAIEKKSTGVTLVSTLKNTPGIRIMDIPRDRSSGSKTNRFLEIQPFIAGGQVSLPLNGKHTE